MTSMLGILFIMSRAATHSAAAPSPTLPSAAVRYMLVGKSLGTSVNSLVHERCVGLLRLLGS